VSNRSLGLDSFDTTVGSEEGATMEVRSYIDGEVLRWPDGRPWTITYYGSDSERIVRVSRQQADRRALTMMRTRSPQLASALDKDAIELLVVATKEWDIPLSDGTPAQNKPDEYRVAYNNHRWLFEQGNDFCGARANFSKALPKS